LTPFLYHQDTVSEPLSSFYAAGERAELGGSTAPSCAARLDEPEKWRN
jgi:hypothetical protein